MVKNLLFLAPKEHCTTSLNLHKQSGNIKARGVLRTKRDHNILYIVVLVDFFVL